MDYKGIINRSIGVLVFEGFIPAYKKIKYCKSFTLCEIKGLKFRYNCYKNGDKYRREVGRPGQPAIIYKIIKKNSELSDIIKKSD